MIFNTLKKKKDQDSFWNIINDFKYIQKLLFVSFILFRFLKKHIIETSFLYTNLDLNFSIFVILEWSKIYCSSFFLQRQIPTSIPGSLYIFLLFSLLDEKTFGSCETHVFYSVENGRAIDRRGQKVIVPNWQKKKKKKLWSL